MRKEILFFICFYQQVQYLLPQEETNEPSHEEIEYNKKQDEVLEKEESLDIF
jgi:hypothetical protein